MSYVKFIDDPLFICNFYYIISYILLFSMFVAGIFISEYLINKKKIDNSIIVSLILISGLIFISSILFGAPLKVYQVAKPAPKIANFFNNPILIRDGQTKILFKSFYCYNYQEVNM